jgi:hypothetical protein
MQTNYLDELAPRNKRCHPKTIYMGHLDESLLSDLECDESPETRGQFVLTISGNPSNNGVTTIVEESVAATSVNRLPTET